MRYRLRGVALHAVLLFALAAFMIPFVWTVIMASNSTADIYGFPPKFTFGGKLDDNVRAVLDNVAFFQSMGNTAIVAVSTTLLVLFFDSLAAFTFAKFRFPGRNALFAILLGTMLLPAQLAAVPQFQTMALLGWVGSLKALIVPGAATRSASSGCGSTSGTRSTTSSSKPRRSTAVASSRRTGTWRCRRPGRRWRSSGSSPSSRPGTTTCGR